MMLRRTFLCLSAFMALSVTHSAYADGGTVDEILRESEGKSLFLDYSYACTESKGRTVRGNGSLVYQRGMFKLVNDPFAIFDDGAVKITMNKSSREAVKEKSAIFGAETMDTDTILRLLGFNPRGASVSSTSGKDGQVNGIKAILKDGTKISVVFKSVKYAPEQPASVFSYDTSTLGQAWTVTDLR